MTSTLAPEAPTFTPTPARDGILGRLVLSSVVLLCLYAALAALNDPGGFLGSDTGGKVLTLRAMEERGSIGGLDVGYWAEQWDPDGDLQPYWGTERTDAGTWVQATTVPMVVSVRPLYDVGGYRLALVWPMLGGLGCALAAWALARGLGGDARARARAFWVVGAASPVLLYAADLWEHSVGLAAMAWAVVVANRVLTPPRDEPSSADPRRAGLQVGAAGLLAGVLWGVAASMRTEAFVYGAVVTAVLIGVGVASRRRLAKGLWFGAGTLAGLVAALAANTALESWVLGGSRRNGRVGDAAGGAGAEVGSRLRDGLLTTFGVGPNVNTIVFGIVAAVALGLLVHRVSTTGRIETVDRLLAVLAALPLLVMVVNGLGFVPGCLVAAPLATAGIVLGRKGPGAPLVWAVVLALPVVWAFQYVGALAAQWGGRYVLLTGLVLTVVAIVHLDRLPGVVGRALLATAVLVTASGAAWMVVRTHGYADAGRQLAALEEPVLVAVDGTGFVPREFPTTDGGQRWLATRGPEELDRARQVVEAAAFDRFGLVVVDPATAPESLGAFRQTSTVSVELVPGARMYVVGYAR